MSVLFKKQKKPAIPIVAKRRTPGDLFKEIIGKPVSDYQGLQEVERAVEDKLGHELELRYCNSVVISRRGDVFPHRDIDMKNVDSRITEFLAKA